MTTIATPSHPSTNTSSHTNTENYLEGLTIHKLLGSAKFCVYLVHSSLDKSYYALKAYPSDSSGHNKYFDRESRFSQLSHPNICKIVATVPQDLIPCDPESSFIVLEYAPYGDFYQFFQRFRGRLSEKLVRTYFRQLIEGLEYLNQRGIAHLDIKCENLLIGKDFKLKITDFDMAGFLNEVELVGRGSVGYRAPEIMVNDCKDFCKADVYSAGIVLFILKSGGIQPYFEQEDFQGVNLYDLLCDDREGFWKVHASFQEDQSFYSENFRELFNMMTDKDPLKRAGIAEIKKSKWYNGPVLNDCEVKTEMKSFYLL